MSRSCCRNNPEGLHRRNPRRPAGKQVRATFDMLRRVASDVLGQSVHVDVFVAPASDFPGTRDYAYCTTEPVAGGKRLIGTAPKMEHAVAERVAALLMHEIAHAALMQLGVPNHNEHEADQMAEAIFSPARIYYDAEDVQTLDEGVRPRPEHLPR